MRTPLEVHLFGSLRPLSPGGTGSPLRLDLDGPAPLGEVLLRLGIDEGLVQLAMVNHRAVPPGALVRPADRLALFPREYAVFVDWKDYRGGEAG